MEKITLPENNYQNTMVAFETQASAFRNEKREKGYDSLPSLKELFNASSLLVTACGIKNSEKIS